MPPTSKLRKFLRPLTVSDLKKIRERHAGRVGEYNGDKNDFIDRLRRSIDGSDETSIEDLTETVLDIRSSDSRQVTTRIRDAVDMLEVSPNAGGKKSKSVREHWISSELFQCLRYEIEGHPYSVEQEKYFTRGTSVDLFVTRQDGNGNYLIELKLAGRSTKDRLPRQLRRYEDKASYRKRTFVVFVAEEENDLPGHNPSLADLIEQVKKRTRTDVLVKPPSDLRYDPA